MAEKKRYSAAEKKSYYMGLGFSLHRDTLLNSQDVKKIGGVGAYNSFVNGVAKMNDLERKLGKECLDGLLNKPQHEKKKKGK